ncbi:Phospholipase/carboxylesterase family protein [Labilithrix luteola]|uniref:Phospholipase/carboxylesterase family protein n=1 Tax=Labilithrix luteola TaxID=1391654 RepID=A0A0K1PNX0_9BACT|nr:Phospholipase/carboxylesterase family protein [Labilithrix luteola]
MVLLHGFGAPGDDLVGLAGAVGAPPGTTFLFPEAPHDLAEFTSLPVYGGARAWWMVDVGRYERALSSGRLGDVIDEVPDGLDEARAALASMFDALAKQGTPSELVVVGGFSQGSMLSVDFALRDARPLRGLVVMSGALIAASEWRPRMKARAGMPLFQSHGTHDPILPYEVAKLLNRELVSAGLVGDFLSFAGGHGIPPETMRDLGTWLGSIA